MPYHHGHLRRALVEAALALLVEGGAAPLTLRQVAKRAGVSPAAPYHHFADKTALLAAVAEEGFRALGRAMKAAAKKERTPRGRLEALGRAYVRFAVAHPAHFGVMFSSALGARWREPPLREVSLAAFALLVEAVEAVLIKEGRRGVDPLEAALLGWSSAHGLAALWIEGPIHRVGAGHRSIDELAQRIARLAAQAIAR